MRPSHRQALLIFAVGIALLGLWLTLTPASPAGFVVFPQSLVTPTPIAEFEVLPLADATALAYPPSSDTDVPLPVSPSASSVPPSPAPSFIGGAYPSASSSSASPTAPLSPPLSAPSVVPAPEPTASASPSVTPAPDRFNPFSNVRLYVDPQIPTRLQADAWRQSRPEDAAQLDKLWPQPVAIWFSGHEADVRARADSLLDDASTQGQVPLIVIYSLPKRDCGGAAAGGFASPAAYRAYVEGIASSLAGRKAIVVLEPDGTAALSCLNASEVATRWDLMRHAIRVLKAQGAAVYVDAANPRWVGVVEMSRRLNELDISEADGFALNVANFIYTDENIRYGLQMSARVGGKPFIIDTSRNGQGPHPDGIWCNPSGRGAGVPFTTQTGDDSVHALVWIKQPGWSDGSCRGGPGSGFYAPFALEHARNANFTWYPLLPPVPSVMPPLPTVLPSVSPMPRPSATAAPSATPVPIAGVLLIDAQQTSVPYVDRGVLGGNSMADRVQDYDFPIFSELAGSSVPSGASLNRPLWRMHLADAGTPRNIWMFDPSEYRRSNGLSNPMIDESFPEFNWRLQYPLPDMDLRYESKADGSASDNYYRVEWFDASLSFAQGLNRHSISYTKVSGSTTQVHRVFPEVGRELSLPQAALYTRFDIQLSSSVPFSVASKAFIMKTGRFHVYLLPDRRLEFRFGTPGFAQSVTTAPLAFDRWYGVDVLNDLTSKVWLDDNFVGQAVLATFPSDTALRTKDAYFGTLNEESVGASVTSASQRSDSYRFKIDEYVVRPTYSGALPQDAADAQVRYRFDANVLTLDDYGTLAERLNFEFVPQLPNPCEIKYGCSTDALPPSFRKYGSVEGLTAMIQYLVLPADADYAAKAQQITAQGWPVTDLRAADGSGSVNYANLRAARGRVAPYSLRYVELGNEPYYAQYVGNEEGFARRFVDLCESIRRIQTGLKCILPTQNSGSFSMDRVLQYIAEQGKQSLVAGMAVHDYFLYPGKDGVRDYPLRSMAAAYADSYRFRQAQQLASKYLSRAVGDPDFPIWINEYNRILVNFKYTATDRFIDSAYLASELAFMLENGVHGGSLFFWNAASPKEKFATGLVGDYAGVPKVNLNGRTFLAFSRYFGWGGRMVPVAYDSLTVHDAVTNTDVPRFTAVSSVSADGQSLYLAVINRDSAAHVQTIQLKNFIPLPVASVYALKANALQDSIDQTDYLESTLAVSANFSYVFPAYSITFFRLDR
ncbi:glycoside hydrolase family 6 protein [Candidatus Micrarchaeota archaeon]|nr:glycoside hydrolase family 6 protein [Candidatus Micrarchaeota archaeon]